MFPPGMAPPRPPIGSPVQPAQPNIPNAMPPGINPIQTGPSPNMLQRVAGGLNSAAQQYGDPMSQGMARQTAGTVNKDKAKKKNSQQLPVNGPPGMKPATSIMSTPGGAPNPYTSMGTVTGNPQPGGYGGLAPAQNSGMGFWNQYNQNRPSMM